MGSKNKINIMPLHTAYDADKGLLPTPRISLIDAFLIAAVNDKPHQPHSQPGLLKVEAEMACEEFERTIRPAIRAVVGRAGYHLGPEKDLARAFQKKPEDIGFNCDFGRNTFYFKTIDQARAAIDIFGRRGQVTLSAGGQSVNVYVMDVDNTFSVPDSRKKGLHELNLKIAVPITLADGEETFHVVESKFIMQSSKKAYELSEVQYQQGRQELRRADTYEAAAANSDPRNTMGICGLGKKAEAAKARGMEFMRERERINLADEKAHKVDSLIGYQPTAVEGRGWKYTAFEDLPLFEAQPVAVPAQPAVRALA